MAPTVHRLCAWSGAPCAQCSALHKLPKAFHAQSDQKKVSEQWSERQSCADGAVNSAAKQQACVQYPNPTIFEVFTPRPPGMHWKGRDLRGRPRCG